MEDLDHPTKFGQGTVDSYLSSHPNYATCRATLGMALQVHFERLRSMDDLDGVITDSQGALAPFLPSDPKFYSVCRDTLGAALMTRFEGLGNVEDQLLHKAIMNREDAQ
jgi:hypothetical protein